jgi:hypothetical protein
LRDIVRREIWEVEVEAVPGKSVHPGAWAILDFIKMKPEQDALRSEREDWNPVHKARVEAGVITNHAVYKLLVPASAMLRPYDYVAANFFNSHGYLADPYPASTVARARQGRNMDELLRTTKAMRSVTKQEYWWRLLTTQ